MGYFQYVKFEMAFIHAEVPRRKVEIEDYKLKDMSVLDRVFSGRMFAKVQTSFNLAC